MPISKGALARIVILALPAAALFGQGFALATREARSRPDLEGATIYQVWMRAFTPEGTLQAAAARLRTSPTSALRSSTSARCRPRPRSAGRRRAGVSPVRTAFRTMTASTPNTGPRPISKPSRPARTSLA